MSLINQLSNIQVIGSEYIPYSLHSGSEWEFYVITDLINIGSPNATGKRTITIVLAFDIPAFIRTPRNTDITGAYDSNNDTLEIEINQVASTRNNRQMAYRTITFDIVTITASDVVKYFRFSSYDGSVVKKKKVVSSDPDIYPIYGIVE